jgi:hypothetical protein
MSKALAIYQDFDGLQKAAAVLYKSGFFGDTKSEAQAIVKVMAGAEMGIAPFASMSGIDIIQGKPTPGANLLATIVDNHPRYDFKVKVATNEKCVIEWFKDGESVGESEFTMQEAKTIKQWNAKKNTYEALADKFNWKNYPSDMLFARALTRGQKRYAPGVAGGAPVYTPEEMGAEVDENGDVIDGESVVTVEAVELPDAKQIVEEVATPPADPVVQAVSEEAIPSSETDPMADDWAPPETVAILMSQAYQGLIPAVSYDMVKIFRDETGGDLKAMLDKIEHEQSKAS